MAERWIFLLMCGSKVGEYLAQGFAQGTKPKKIMPGSLIEIYKAHHQHPLNRLMHSIGIPLILISLPLFFFRWRVSLTLFIGGWIFQLVGHAIEGNRPAFFKRTVHLFVGPWWLVRRAATAIGLIKAAAPH